MKKTIAFVLGATLAFSAAAQTWQDALLFSENVYSGTARGVGMGNALTAIGGDAGSIGFNPAGSATAGYSQFMISPGITFSVTGTNASGDNSALYTGQQVNNTYARVKLPNIGFILKMDTGRRSGLKRMAFGIVVNSTNNFTGRYKAAGVNGDNSYAASLASLADCYPENVIANESSYYNKDSRLQYYPKWSALTGYHSGMYNVVPGNDGSYVAVTEVYEKKPDGTVETWLAAPVSQQYGQQSTGFKTDAILNYAFNFSDRFYIGGNLGITAVNYSLSEFWSEAPENPADFPYNRYSDGSSAEYTAQFESLRMNHKFNLRGTGVYFKLGALWRPSDHLRLAAAIQTPTLINITERYGYSSEVKLSGRYTSTSSSPEDEWIYALRSPFRFNFGVAYTLGEKGVISADYELVNYNQARFRYRTSDYGYAEGDFRDLNTEIKNVMGSVHEIRLGTEFKVTSQLSLRAGYNLTTGAQYNYWDGYEKTPLSSEARLLQLKHSASLGLGFNFGSIFLDAAVRARFVPDDYMITYDYYTTPYPDGDYSLKYVNNDFLTPEIVVKSTLVDAILTVGWRF